MVLVLLEDPDSYDCTGLGTEVAQSSPAKTSNPAAVLAAFGSGVDSCLPALSSAVGSAKEEASAKAESTAPLATVSPSVGGQAGLSAFAQGYGRDK